MEFRPAFLCILFAPLTLGLGLDFDSDLTPDLSSLDATFRTFIPIPISSGGSGMNASIFAALAAALASALLSLLTLTGLGLLVASNMDKDKHSHGGYGHGGHHTSYRTYGPYSRMLETLDWETLTLVDWFSIIKEVWDTFDPTDLECQKRFICDLHQSKDELGPVADSLTYYVSYLKYGEVLSLPETLKSIIEEYADAATLGQTMTKECGDIYSFCDFSVKDLIKKYSPRYSDDPEKGDQDSIESKKEKISGKSSETNITNSNNVTDTVSNAGNTDTVNNASNTDTVNNAGNTVTSYSNYDYNNYKYRDGTIYQVPNIIYKDNGKINLSNDNNNNNKNYNKDNNHFYYNYNHI
ncbi:UNVERIFIED_CONTAM: hypothetical protein RMT77_009677 [Armadillidium vulgare]